MPLSPYYSMASEEEGAGHHLLVEREERHHLLVERGEAPPTGRERSIHKDVR
jgi:hypothetical protein